MEMADNLGKTHESLKEFLKNYFTVLSPEILEKLESAAANAEAGALYGRDEYGQGPGNKHAELVYQKINDCTSMLKAEVDGQRLVKFHEYTKKHS